MKEEFKTVLKVEVGEAMRCRVRQRAVHEEMVKHYAGLRRFGGEILRSNRNNTMKICTTRLQEGDAPHFQRFYVCYDALKRAWADGCRPVLGLDGCFLKNICGGQLLSAVGKDGNNSILPIAMTVVETESYDSWKWFLELLIEDLDLMDGYGFTFISDQQKGLDKTIVELIPHVEHRFCTRHIYSNLRKKFPSQAVRTAFYNCVTATHPEAFKISMKELERISKGAAERMKEFDLRVWSKAYYATHSKSDSTENNMSKCFNAWILKFRYMPIIDMLTDIHDMFMERLYEKRDFMDTLDCLIGPKIKKRLDLAIKESNECSPLWDGNCNFQVKWRGVGYCVNLDEFFYSCRVWELLPCSHAISAIQKARKNPLDFVSDWYKKEKYMRTYSHCLQVIRGEPFWEEVEGDTILPPLVVKKLRGRPKKMRRREGWEERVSKGKYVRLSRVGRIIHCTFCKEEEHNITKCPTKPEGYKPPKKSKKRGRKRKNITEEEVEVEVMTNELVSGEAELKIYMNM